jgi:hypothetical protein
VRGLATPSTSTSIAARASARELLAWLDVADKRLVEGYEGSAIPAPKERFAEARHKLEALSR